MRPVYMDSSSATTSSVAFQSIMIFLSPVFLLVVTKKDARKKTLNNSRSLTIASHVAEVERSMWDARNPRILGRL